jgi:hypothetical protein
MRRAVSAAALVALGLLISAAVLLRLGPSVFRAPGSVETDRQSAEASLERLLQVEQEALRSLDDRPVYPYSVVPGGVRDAQELKWAADHDPVVAAHYAGFDYDHARIVRLVLARTAYVSYRIGNKVYWTRHRVSLKKGETLITDGKITTRTRCANRVEEAPQQLSSSPEPPAAKFEEPIHPSVGTAIESPPVPFQSALLSRPGLPEPAPLPALSLSSPFGNGVWVPIAPPPLPSVCGVSKPKGGGGGTGGHKGTGNPCPSGGVVPEPDTWLLVASGLAAIYWKARRTLAGSWGNPDQGFCGPR